MPELSPDEARYTATAARGCLGQASLQLGGGSAPHTATGMGVNLQLQREGRTSKAVLAGSQPESKGVKSM